MSFQPFHFHFSLDKALNNSIVCLMISQKLQTKVHKRASMLQLILGRFECSQNEFEIRRTKNVIEEEPLNTSAFMSYPVTPVRGILVVL